MVKETKRLTTIRVHAITGSHEMNYRTTLTGILKEIRLKMSL